MARATVEVDPRLIAFVLPSTPESVRTARFHVRAALGFHGLDDYAEDAAIITSSVSGGIRRLYDFELEPEVRGRLDSLSDADFKRSTRYAACLPRRAPNSAAHGPITWRGRSGNCGSGCAMCGQDHLLVYF
jgi:hypothetical protein